VTLHDASTIAAVIVSPSPVPRAWYCPAEYPQAAAEICDNHGILLIFDEVITGFGRTGSALRRRSSVDARHDHLRQGPHQRLCPHGCVLASKKIYDAFMQGPPAPSNCSATLLRIPSLRRRLATLKIYE
jgi:beta-alanine--pyruvate transaminase